MSTSRASAVANGALQRLPYVRTASEIQEMKFWRAPVRESHRIVDPVKRAKNHTSRVINMQLSKLSSVTRQASLDFPALKRMHPFEREVVMLTLGKGTYERHLQTLRRVYASLHNTGKQYERECQELRTKQEAVDCGLRCVEELKKIVDDSAGTLRDAANMAKVLRGLPHVDLDKPIFAFVGAPNVGKSSLVRALSTASPEVANYPFTTRGITMGHIFVEGISYQIADTPGLIFRPDESRNAIEKLAIAMMEKTQASIGFVFDPTGSSGTPTSDQILLRDELRQRVTAARPEHKWIDIISKIDQPSDDAASLKDRLGSCVSVSAQTNEGLMELGDGIRRVLTESACADGFLE
ncbi:hypothetical protein PF005_g13148 [Phytophthora fragariae]|uniref:OBG-type G domain-containing protein n=1 Tax=Phytophthora fragariae TaxID=53985 RepID=A0A6A3EVG5_9STRA|nr:hypothetical protein PF003_g7227 [Phytophthora fragariae]KAE8935510.1 hypothetical protein PF009_g14539 [Phytophthora fragariae]KAE9006565.1 hypothetical protein PF011_g11520 [Phytophthora fragariae]KAE9105942.1 hypothetical protein PF007_g13585 [Phytophthora fragariae]KAE9142470.1 hypothetical protein PF006_g12419 [Phytophthora fragariae]